jgi:hypothetical protein
MLIGTMRGHEIRDRDGRGTPSRCVAPDGSTHGSSEQACSHLIRIYNAAREGTIPEELSLTPDGARAARACKCLKGRYRPPPPKQEPPPPAAEGENSKARRARKRAGEQRAWELDQIVNRALAAAERARVADTADEGDAAAEEAAHAAREARASADAARGTDDAKEAERRAKVAAKVAKVAAESARIDRILEGIHAKEAARREKRRAKDAAKKGGK